MITIKVIAALVILFSLNVAASASEEAEPDQAAPQDAKEPARCATEQSGFRSENGVNMYYVEVTSACEKPMRCTINAYVMGSRGGKAGEGTLTFPAASPGQEAKKTWSMRTADNGGMASMSWRCKDI